MSNLAPRAGFPSSRPPRRTRSGQASHPAEPIQIHKPGTRPACRIWLAPRAGFEPATYRLTADCSTIELPRNEITTE